jgi:hypothetical protein
MERATYEDLQHELNLLFKYNPPTHVPSKSSSECPKLAQPPLIFYDKHLDERLTLKRVVLMPSTTARLSETVDKTLDQQGLSLPLDRLLDTFPTEQNRTAYKFERPIVDANSVARAYRVTVAARCMTVASMLSLSPHASSWDTALNWIQGVVQSEEEYFALEESYVLQFLKIPGKAASRATHQDPFMISNTIWDSMDGETRERLSHAARKFPALAVWQIFAISKEAENFMNEIASLASLEAFCHKKSSTLGYASASPRFLPYAPDAMSTAWGISVASLCEYSGLPELSPNSSTLPNSHITVDSGSKRSQIKKPTITRHSRPTRTTETRTSSAEKWPDVTILGPAGPTNGSLASSLLQHVWGIHSFSSM